MSDRTVLVTGVTGFVGPHAAAELAAAGWSVVGLGRDAEPGPAGAHLVDYVEADLGDPATRLPSTAAVLHLAGLAEVGPSFGHPQRYITLNSAMMTTLGEDRLRSGRPGRIVVVSSGAVYALPAGGSAQSEDAPLGFGSPYAVSKVLVENQAAYYRGRGVDVAVARPFNHIGPGQRRGFLVPDLIATVRDAIESGGPVVTGDLSTVRDYTDVRDVARAYAALLGAPRLEHAVYNVCSGRGTSGEELLDAVAAALGAPALDRGVDPARARPNDAPRIVGDASRIADELGWRPSIPTERTVGDAIAAR